jgi:capsular polysaccharide biosynthesis protein/Mrp family chromosome partitioning ATPase
MTDDASASEQPSRPGFVASVLRHWWLVVLVTLAVTVGTVVAASLPPSTYQAVSVVSFLPVKEYQADLLRLTLPRYQAYASSTDQIDVVAKELGLDKQVVRDAVSVEIPAESPNITITATTTSPARSAAIANRLAELTSDFSAADGVVRPADIQKATEPTSPSGPPRMLLSLAGFLIGLALGVAAALVLERLRPAIRNRSDLERVTDGRPLTTVPAAASMRTDPFAAAADGGVGAAARRVRSSVNRLAASKGAELPLVIVVTGAELKAGASSVARLLAGSYARDERAVVVLDTDLDARPGTEPPPVVPTRDRTGDSGGPAVPAAPATVEAGLATSTRVEAGGVEVIRWTDRVAGPVTRTALRQQLATLQDRVVVVDALPVSVDDAAQVASELADVTVLVVLQRSRERFVTTALDELGSIARGKVLVVGNKFPDRPDVLG